MKALFVIMGLAALVGGVDFMVSSKKMAHDLQPEYPALSPRGRVRLMVGFGITLILCSGGLFYLATIAYEPLAPVISAISEMLLPWGVTFRDLTLVPAIVAAAGLIAVSIWLTVRLRRKWAKEGSSDNYSVGAVQRREVTVVLIVAAGAVALLVIVTIYLAASSS